MRRPRSYKLPKTAHSGTTGTAAGMFHVTADVGALLLSACAGGAAQSTSDQTSAPTAAPTIAVIPVAAAWLGKLLTGLPLFIKRNAT